MTCSKCGAALEANARFCNKCGAAVARTQPSREEIRARVQGGGRPASPGRLSPGIGGLPALTGDQSMLFYLGAALLGVLQILYLMVKTLFLDTGFGSYSLSVFGTVKDASVFLAVLLLLACLAVLASVAVPMILRSRPRTAVTAILSLLMLALYVLALVLIRAASEKANFGLKPSLGFFGWMFILNCLLIPGLVFLAGRGEESAPAPARAAAPARPAAKRRPVSTAPVSPARQAPLRRGVNGPARPSAPTQHVTPPDAETIAALRRMAQMHKEGLVSDQEFARIKAECVARGWIRE